MQFLRRELSVQGLVVRSPFRPAAEPRPASYFVPKRERLTAGYSGQGAELTTDHHLKFLKFYLYCLLYLLDVQKEIFGVRHGSFLPARQLNSSLSTSSRIHIQSEQRSWSSVSFSVSGGPDIWFCNYASLESCIEIQTISLRIFAVETDVQMHINSYGICDGKCGGENCSPCFQLSLNKLYDRLARLRCPLMVVWRRVRSVCALCMWNPRSDYAIVCETCSYLFFWNAIYFSLITFLPISVYFLWNYS